MNFKKLILLMVLQLSTAALYSQTLIKGTVLSGDDQGPLPGVSIFVKGTNFGTSSDFDGNFNIKVPEGATTLVFSYIGYTSQEILIDGRSSVDCLLLPELNSLDEVVIVGYGSAKKGSITGSVATIDSESLEDRSVGRIEQALAGQMAGVRVQETSGALGAPLEISIRGQTSISADSKPLYVVDGFPTDNIGDLVTADIETISVLKDAAEAAIYGSRGANGVVLITTKKGKRGKPKVSYSGRFGLQTVEKKIDVLTADEWIDLNVEVINKRWVDRGAQRGRDYKATDDAAYRESELGGFNKTYMHDPRWFNGSDDLTYIDWQDELFRTAAIQEHQITASGASDNVNYYVSGTYFQQDGIIKYTDITRVNFRSNLKIKLNDKLSLNMNLAPTTIKGNGGAVGGRGKSVHVALKMAPIVETDAGVDTGVSPYQNYRYAGTNVSPVAYMRDITEKNDELAIRSNIDLEYKISNFRAKLTGGLQSTAKKTNSYVPTRVQLRNTNIEEGVLSTASVETERDNKYLLQATLDYNKTFGKKHKVTALLGYSVEARERDKTIQKHVLLNTDKLITFDQNTSTPNRSSYKINENNMISYFAKASYDYDNRYLVQGSVRRDGSSKFGSNNLWGVFPAVAVGWRMENEAFMENVDVVSHLKLRSSYGVGGNNRVKDYVMIEQMASRNYSFGNDISYGFAPGTLENKDLGWEMTATSNFGLDIGILKNRFFMSFDYYIKETFDKLFSVPIPSATGFSNRWENIGSMRNRGWEFELTTKNLVNDFIWQTSLNFSYIENEIRSLGSNGTPILTGFSGKTQIHKIGETAGSFFLYDAIGVYKNQDEVDNSPARMNGINTISKPGDVKYRDVNNDGIIDESDKTVVGTPIPDYYWGMTNIFRYKSLELSILLTGQVGGNIYSLLGRGGFDSPDGQIRINRPAQWKYRWRSETDTGNGSVPRIDGTTSQLYDTRWLYDATYWKIKNVKLSYKIPKNILPGISSARIYCSGENLFMKYKYEYGYSPEARNTSGGDYGGYPLARVISFGCKLQF